MCNCRWTEIILGAIILVFALWKTVASTWLVVIAAALIIVHAFACKNLASCCAPAMPAAVPSARKRK